MRDLQMRVHKAQLLFLLLASPLAAQTPVPEAPSAETPPAKVSGRDPVRYCQDTLPALAAASPESWRPICESAKQLSRCSSVAGEPILHFDKIQETGLRKRILVFALLHGDETESGQAAARWIQRLAALDPRSNWRVIPVANPDGFQKGTRTNINGVDLNRNFPTEDWSKDAIKKWESTTQKNPRRFPGHQAASEPETLCAVDQIDDFKPDLIISIHTPYGVLDFDGPRQHKDLIGKRPWVSLGNFPGSLGRYMWKDKNLPVLTIELPGKGASSALWDYDGLQDFSGRLATGLK